MTDRPALPVLFSESQIRSRVADIAEAIARLPDKPDLAVPVLIGGFVFAADLLRALDRSGLSLPVEFIRLRSYGDTRSSAGAVSVLAGPVNPVQGRHVLLIDGVLDHGHTLARARELVLAAGARAATTAVAIDKRRDEALLQADFAAFAGVAEFVVGYGMDDAGQFRSLPYICAAG